MDNHHQGCRTTLSFAPASGVLDRFVKPLAERVHDAAVAPWGFRLVYVKNIFSGDSCQPTVANCLPVPYAPDAPSYSRSAKR